MLSLMGFVGGGAQHFEVTYQSVEDMAPALQPPLLAALERAVAAGPVSVLFKVNTLDVPRAVPEFWLGVTRRLAPRLCAMAIVSDSLAVRAAASGFSVTNRVRRVKLEVKAFVAAEEAAARSWCDAQRAGPKALSPTLSPAGRGGR